MQKEITTGTFLGLVLIALAFIIGLAFGIFTIAKGVGTEGQVNVSEVLNTASTLTFVDYDQKVVTGNRLLALYSDFEGTPIAVLVNTKSMTNGIKTDIGDVKYIQNIGGVNYINYNALISNDGAGELEQVARINGGETVINGNENVIDLKDGVASSHYGFIVDNSTGKIKMSSNIKGWGNAGCSEYINTSSKFKTNLLKGTSSEIIGVLFTQID